MLKKIFIFISLIFCSCGLAITAYQFFVHSNISVVAENGNMELYQTAFLLFAGISFAIQAAKTFLIQRMLIVFLSLLSFIMMHREVETGDLNLPYIIDIIFLSSSRFVLIIPAVFLLGCLLCKVPYFWRNRSQIIFKPTTITLFFGIVCYLFLNEFFENGLFTGVYDIFFEEGVEMIGATLFFIASLCVVDDYQWMSISAENNN